jgi:hypothetical protein
MSRNGGVFKGLKSREALKLEMITRVLTEDCSPTEAWVIGQIVHGKYAAIARRIDSAEARCESANNMIRSTIKDQEARK